MILGIDGARARFWAKVDIAGSDECWEWSGGRNAKGYGIFFLGGSRLTDDQVRWLRSAFASGTSKRSLAQSLGVTRRTAKLAIEGRTWGHIS